MPLGEYRRKRDPEKTPEPFSGQKSRSGGPIFVIQRHDARRLHYDLRLEEAGALASWAVPKGVPLEPGDRALAVHVEDHPLDYATFEGEIPAGEYGAGTVEVWDTGTYELVERKPNGQRTFVLHGRRLRGSWSLVPAHLDGKEQNWLLIRRSDGAATEEAREYRPMLATAVEQLPHGAEWRYEVKFDGYRALAYIRGGDCRLVSRNGNDLTERFAKVTQEVVKATKSPHAVLDGEVCRVDDDGRASFSNLQQNGGALAYFVFDLLELDGEPLVDEPYVDRKRRLADALDSRNATVSVSADFEDGDALLEVVKEQRFEGIVAKRASSVYRPGKRTRDWLKLKIDSTGDFVIAGYTRGSGRRAQTFGSLVLGAQADGELRYVGNVGTGFDDAEIERLLGLLAPLQRDSSPFPTVPAMPRVRKDAVQWVEPRLQARVRFGEWTHEGHLRQPAYLGLRDDLPEPPPGERPDVLRRGRRELRLSNLDKVFWPDEGITKGDLLDYYQAVAPVLVPHLAHRPVTLRRYPDGAFGKAFFQKDAPSHMPEWIPRFRAAVSARDKERTRKEIDFPVVDDELSLLWMVNMGCIDLNTWYSRIDRPDRPDYVLFDLDPTPEVPWAQTVEVALIVKELLDHLGLDSFPKTSGGKGFHVLVPLDRRSTYDDTRSFAEIVAGAVARAHPKLATTEWAKTRRRGVLIDANQNGQGKTIASVYSVRPHPKAPVSTPLGWDEVNESLDPSRFTMAAVLDRVRAHGDVYAGLLTTRQSLSKALKLLA